MSIKTHWFYGSNFKLFYRIKGTGPPVLLLHGYALDSRIWEKMLENLPENYTWIIPDLPGFGASTLPENTDPDLDKVALMLKALLDELKLNSCTWIGHSLGGYIILSALALFPQYIKHFGLFHSTANPDSAEKIALRKKNIRFIHKYGASQYLKLLHQYVDTPSAVLIFYQQAMLNRPNNMKEFQAFSGRILLIIGQNDPSINLNREVGLSILSNFCYIHILKSAGHLGMLEEPEKSCQILVSFLQ